jgi:hypothetical protein
MRPIHVSLKKVDFPMGSVDVFNPVIISVGSVVVLTSLLGPVVVFDPVVIPGK